MRQRRHFGFCYTLAGFLLCFGCLSPITSRGPTNRDESKTRRNTHSNGLMVQYLDEATNERICLIEHYAAVCCVGYLYEAAFFDIVAIDDVGETYNSLENRAFFKGLLNRTHLRRIVRECVVILDVESEPASIQVRTKYCRVLLDHVEHMVAQYVTDSNRDLNAGEIELAFLKGDHNWKRFFLILLTSHFKQILHEEIADALGLEAPQDAVKVDLRDEEKVSLIIGLFRRELERRYGTTGVEQKSEDVATPLVDGDYPSRNETGDR